MFLEDGLQTEIAGYNPQLRVSPVISISADGVEPCPLSVVQSAECAHLNRQQCASHPCPGVAGPSYTPQEDREDRPAPAKW